MTGLLVITGLFALFLILLVTESIRHNRRISNIPIRITVSGTRGKSSTVRTLATIFRLHGIRTLAKTTGSEAALILPDGTLESIPRKGQPSIREQIGMIRRAAREGVECTITEIMSIRPENHRTETHKILKPGVTLLTNFRPDHTDSNGDTVEDMARVYALDLYQKSKVFVLDKELNPFIDKEINRLNAIRIPVRQDLCRELGLPDGVFDRHHADNLDLVVSVARHFGIPDTTVSRGIRETLLDIGQTGIYRLAPFDHNILFINTFAANDPVSSLERIRSISEAQSVGWMAMPDRIGFLALRADRGERSRQWLDFLRSAEGQSVFTRIFVAGAHSEVFARKLSNCVRISSRKPEQILEIMTRDIRRDTLIFGLVNIHGTGLSIINHLDSNPFLKTDNP